MRSEHAESTVKAARRATTAKGFEPSRAEPNGFLVHLLNHSDTVSLQSHGEPGNDEVLKHVGNMVISSTVQLSTSL